MATKKMEALKKAADAMAEFDDKLSKTQKVFPMLNLIYSATFLFGDDGYQRVVMAYKDPALTKILADYIQYIVDEDPMLFAEPYGGTRVQRIITGYPNDIIRLYCGIGVTDEMRDTYAKFNKKSRPTSRNGCRVGPGGLHPHAIAQIYGLEESGPYLGSQAIPRLFRQKFDKYSRSLTDIVEAYIKGDRATMLATIPEPIRNKLGLKNTNYDLPEGISAEDMNKIGKWFAELPKKTEINRPSKRACWQVGEWLQETFPANEQSSQNIAITTAIKDAKSNKR